MAKGERYKCGKIEFEVVGESVTQRVISSVSSGGLLGYGYEEIAQSLGDIIQRGRVVAVIAPDHSGTSRGIVVVLDKRLRGNS